MLKITIVDTDTDQVRCETETNCICAGMAGPDGRASVLLMSINAISIKDGANCLIAADEAKKVALKGNGTLQLAYIGMLAEAAKKKPKAEED